MQHIVIIGAGVVGAAIAYHLRGRAIVTVIESHGVAAGASSKGFGWIYASFSETPAYHALRRAAMAAHVDLNLPETRWGGSLWWEAEGAAFDAQVSVLRGMNYPVQVLDRPAFVALEPDIARPPDRCLLAPAEGATDGAAFARALLAASGAVVMPGQAARLTYKAGRVTGVRCTDVQMAADAVVIAAGAGSVDLLAPLDLTLPITAKPGLILYTNPAPPILNHLILAPGIHFRQATDGRIVAGEIFSGDGPGAARITTDPQGLAEEMMVQLRARLPKTDLRLETIMLGRRPLPTDGMPLIGPVPGYAGAHLAVMHSGVTLAPLVGRLLADEILGQGDALLLADFRPSRLM